MTRIEVFLRYLQAEKRYATHTVRAYKNDLLQFRAFCIEMGHEEMDLHHRTIRSWVVHLMDNHYSNRSVHRKLTSLRTFARYLIQQGELQSNPLDRVLKPRLNKRVPAFVEEGQMDMLLEDYDFGDDFSGIRNRLIMDLLYQTGMRRSELVGLKLASLDLEGMQLKVTGKQSKERILPLHGKLVDSVQKYLVLREEVVSGSGEDSLLVTEKGKAVYDQLIYRIVRRYLAMVTTLGKKSPHVLRHTFATHMLNNGADLQAIKELLGHANLSATQVYTHNTFKKLKSVYNRAHPRA